MVRESNHDSSFFSVTSDPSVSVLLVSSIHVGECFLVGVFPGFPKHLHRYEKIMVFQEYNVYVFRHNIYAKLLTEIWKGYSLNFDMCKQNLENLNIRGIMEEINTVI